MPQDLVVTGSGWGARGEDDWYALPALPAGATVAVSFEGDVARIGLADATSELRLTGDMATGSLTAPPLVAAGPVWLRVTATGPYRVALSGDGVVPLPPVGALDASLALVPDDPEVAGYLLDAQRMAGHVSITNPGGGRHAVGPRRGRERAGLGRGAVPARGRHPRWWQRRRTRGHPRAAGCSDGPAGTPDRARPCASRRPGHRVRARDAACRRRACRPCLGLVRAVWVAGRPGRRVAGGRRGACVARRPRGRGVAPRRPCRRRIRLQRHLPRPAVRAHRGPGRRRAGTCGGLRAEPARRRPIPGGASARHRAAAVGGWGDVPVCVRRGPGSGAGGSAHRARHADARTVRSSRHPQQLLRHVRWHRAG